MLFRSNSKDHETLQYGDRIQTVDGVKITTADEVVTIANRKRVGDTLTLEVVRRGEVKTLTVTVIEKKPAAKTAEE